MNTFWQEHGILKTLVKEKDRWFFPEGRTCNVFSVKIIITPEGRAPYSLKIIDVKSWACLYLIS